MISITYKIGTNWIRKPLIRIIEFFNFKIVFPLIRLIGKINPHKEYHYTLGTGWWQHTFWGENTFPLTTADFEGFLLPVPKDMDAYLTNVYGDWRTPPEEEEIKKAIHSQEYRDEIFGKNK